MIFVLMGIPHVIYKWVISYLFNFTQYQYSVPLLKVQGSRNLQIVALNDYMGFAVFFSSKTLLRELYSECLEPTRETKKPHVSRGFTYRSRVCDFASNDLFQLYLMVFPAIIVVA